MSGSAFKASDITNWDGQEHEFWIGKQGLRPRARLREPGDICWQNYDSWHNDNITFHSGLLNSVRSKSG